MKVLVHLRVALVVSVLGVSVGCGGSTGPQQADVSGAWTLSLSNLSGSGVSCTASGTTINLTQTGSTFSGSYTGGVFSCSGNGQTNSTAIGTGSIVSGTVSGNHLTFDLDTPNFALTGTVSGNSMSGTATANIDLGAPVGIVTLRGNWASARAVN